MDQVREIAKTKQEDLNANDIEAAAKIIAGTARSMGITVEAEPLAVPGLRPRACSSTRGGPARPATTPEPFTCR